MKKTLFFFLVMPLFFAGCRQNTEATEQVLTLQRQLTETTTALEKAQTTLGELKQAEQKSLLHTVYFKLKPDLTDEKKAALIEEINKLEAIAVVQNLEVGTFQDLGDARALSEYGLAMQMDFESIEAYQTYQAHEVHLALKQAVGAYLAGPPATYDYWTD